jgi:hypothetical protein
LGLNGLLLSVALSEYEGRFSEPKMPWIRQTVNPPRPTTTTMTSGIQDRCSTLKIEIPFTCCDLSGRRRPTCHATHRYIERGGASQRVCVTVTSTERRKQGGTTEP